jgi:branched-chain amino acid transport system substrate-binding protein
MTDEFGVSGGLTRRRLLRRAGLLGAAASSPAVLSACSGSAVEEGGDTAASEPAGGATTAASPTTAASGGGGGEPLTVGLLIPLSGVYTVLGESMRQGYQLYLDQNPDAFGGRSIETIEADEGETPDSGVRAAQRLVDEEQVAMVVGIVNSAVALGTRDLFDERQIPLIIANAGANDITGAAASPYIFRVSFSNRQPNYSLGQYMYDEVAQDGVYLIAPDYAAGAEQMAGFREAFEAAGGIIVGESRPPFAQTQDYQPFLAEIRNAGAQAVHSFFSGGEAVTFVQQYQQFGLKESIPLLGSGFLTEGAVLQGQGAAADGIRTSLHYVSDLDNERNTEFVSAFEEAYGGLPDVFALQAYDAAKLLDQGLQETEGNTEDIETFVEAMASVEIDSPRGAFRLDENRNPIQMFYLREVRDGQNYYVQDLIEVGPPE